MQAYNQRYRENIKLLTTPIKTILELLAKSELKIIFLADKNHRLVGSVTDGDIRRWLLASPEKNLSTPVKQAMNPNPARATEHTTSSIRKRLLLTHKAVPVVNNTGQIVDVQTHLGDCIQIDTTIIGPGNPCFVIAEIGVNHNGSINVAKQLIDASVVAGAQAVKFQMRDLEYLYGSNFRQRLHQFDLATQYTIASLIKTELPEEAYEELFEYSRKNDIIPMCTPWDKKSLGALERLNPPAYKVASADLTNHELLLQLIKTNKPIIVSTGMSTESEILETSELLRDHNAAHGFLHSNSTYPTPDSDINLSYLERLQRITGAVIGYSGHERGINISIAATALGASIIERHITLNKNDIGPDHKASLEPKEFNDMVAGIRQIEKAIGTVGARKISQGEMLNRENLSKSIFAAATLESGHKVTESDCVIRAPGSGIQPNKLSAIIGRELKQRVNCGQPIYWSHFESKNKKMKYNFPLKYGIPVRFHDIEELLNSGEVDLVEFHLSQDDLFLRPENFLSSYPDTDLVVHAPELFAGDHIIDLASADAVYRAESIQHLQNVVDLTIDLKRYFSDSDTPRIIINAGGWSRDSFITDEAEKRKAYERIGQAIKVLERNEVILLIQTMPPFPWHLGGQSHHNLFVIPEEIKRFCLTWNSLICLDASHSQLACEFYGLEFNDFVDTVKEYVDHAHLSDANGYAEEGLEIGEGIIDFHQVLNQLTHSPRKPSFIPEIWQGHKDRGKKFWESLKHLESMFVTAKHR